MLARAIERNATRDTQGSIALARQALSMDPDYVEGMEHLATALITRLAHYREGIGLVDRMVALRGDDAAVWYAAGWLYEFAAHEIRRRPTAGDGLDAHALYGRAAAAFRACLALHPEGKLQGDAEDLLDHIENELAQ